jgi:hypothetical protein
MLRNSSTGVNCRGYGKHSSKVINVIFIFIPCMMIILEIIYFLLNTIRGRENSEKEIKRNG